MRRAIVPGDLIARKSAMPVKAQYIVRVGVLAVALGVGAAVANTPGVAFAEPTDSQFF